MTDRPRRPGHSDLSRHSDLQPTDLLAEQFGKAMMRTDGVPRQDGGAAMPQIASAQKPLDAQVVDAEMRELADSLQAAGYYLQVSSDRLRQEKREQEAEAVLIEKAARQIETATRIFRRLRGRLFPEED